MPKLIFSLFIASLILSSSCGTDDKSTNPNENTEPVYGADLFKGRIVDYDLGSGYKVRAIVNNQILGESEIDNFGNFEIKNINGTVKCDDDELSYFRRNGLSVSNSSAVACSVWVAIFNSDSSVASIERRDKPMWDESSFSSYIWYCSEDVTVLGEVDGHTVQLNMKKGFNRSVENHNSQTGDYSLTSEEPNNLGSWWMYEPM